MSLEPGGRIHVAPWFRDRLIGLVVVYVLLLAMLYTNARLLQPGRVRGLKSPPVAEAQAWLQGRTDLAERLWDTALIDGRVYNVFPPLMTFVSAAVLPWSPKGIPFTLISALFVMPIPWLAYALFLRRCDTVAGAVVLSCTFVLGTSEFLILCRTLQSADVCQLNSEITQLGLLIFLIDYFGKRRFWIGGVGLLIMGWARQPMWAYLVPYLWGIWERHQVVRPRVGGVAFVVVLLAVPAAVSVVRFGNPLETAYGKIYEERTVHDTDWLARDGARAVFSVEYVPRNLYWMNLGFPKIVEHHGGWRWVPSVHATGIWWTTPVLLYVFFDGRRIWRERANRWLMPPVAAIVTVLLLYHNMGYSQRGYNRFSLDFLLVLLVWIAPYAMRGRRRYVTVAAGLWSVYYFRFIVQ